MEGNFGFMKKIMFAALAVVCFSVTMHAQPRPVDRDAAQSAKRVPDMIKARYDGGTFGSTGKQKGYFKFDDANQRVVFYRDDGREILSISYTSLVMIYPDTKEHTSQTGNVISRLPLPGAGLAGLKSTESKYLNLTFDDPDIDVKGTANFKFNDKELLLSFIDALGTKAKMKQRGQAYYRPKKTDF
jgi:hypothetical protein